MPIKRLMPGVAALNSKIYVTGGCNDDNQPNNLCQVSSVDCYDPDTNTWSQVANMNIARTGHSLVSLHGSLYAIGGDRGVDSVEFYDPLNNTWTLLQNKVEVKLYCTGAGACNIKKYFLPVQSFP